MNKTVLNWDRLRERAKEHAEKIAQNEIEELQKSLKKLMPEDVPVTIQIFQPVDGGRLIDVGPRPKGAPGGLVFQKNNVGRTGDIFQDAQASHRYIPLPRMVSSIEPGTFSEEILRLEKLRYPGIGRWTDYGPPPTSWIHQLPLASLPQTLRPRTNDEKYRYAKSWRGLHDDQDEGYSKSQQEGISNTERGEFLGKADFSRPQGGKSRRASQI